VARSGAALSTYRRTARPASGFHLLRH